MTDEHPELNRIEMLNGLRSMAEGTRVIYQEFVEQGFTEADALRLTAAYLHGLAGGKLT